MTAKQEMTKNDSAQVPVSDVFFFDVAVDVGRDLPGHAIARASGCHGCDNAMARAWGISMLIAFPVSMVTVPITQKLVSIIVASE